MRIRRAAGFFNLAIAGPLDSWPTGPDVGVVLTSELAAAIIDVSVGPGLTTFTRMPRSANSFVQVRADDRMAALLALYAP